MFPCTGVPVPNMKARKRERCDGAEFLCAAAAACPHGLMIEQAGRVVYANPALARILGLRSVGDVLGRKLADLPPVLSPTLDSAGGVRPRTVRPQYDSLRLAFRHGAQPIAMHVVRDVTESRRMEQRLRESEKMEALGRLVGGVAHDFNNVLTAITLYSDLLSERAAGLREAHEIRLAAQRGTAIVRQLLAFARQQPLAPRVVCLQRIVTSMRGMLEPLLGENIELITEFSCPSDLVRVDPAQVQQVILNLVMNARDAMPNGGQVRIATGCCALNARSAQRHPG